MSEQLQIEDAAKEHTSGYSIWVHGISLVLTVVVFLLIGFGTLVTTLDAGMAVPDWPNTYGWNMFSYPASTWLFGPFDLLAEHSHRLMGTLAGLFTIALCLCAVWFDKRSWFKKWTVLLLVAVVAQGALGGARVVMDDRTFAMIHGCTGPLFFAIVAATAVMSSRWWHRQSLPTELRRREKEAESSLGQYATGRGYALLASFLVLTSYAQLVVGAQVRHVTGLLSHKAFKGLVHGHLGLAGLLLLLVLALCGATLWSKFQADKIRGISRVLALFVLVQICLGVGTWLVNYALPWTELDARLAHYTINAKGYWESAVVTAHAATGSIILALCTVLALRCWRTRFVDHWDGNVSRT